MNAMVKKVDEDRDMDIKSMMHMIDESLAITSIDPTVRSRMEAGRSVLQRVCDRGSSKTVGKNPNLSCETLRCVSEPISATATPRVLPISNKPRFKKLEVVWKHSCVRSVSVFGTFSEPAWIEEFRMTRDPADGYYKVDLSDRGLSPGTYIFKYVVDGEWRIDPTLPTRSDLNGHVNNTMFVRSTLRPLKTVRSAPTVETANSTPSSSSSYPSASLRFGLPLSRANTPLLQDTTVINRRPASVAVPEDSRQTCNLALLCGAWMIPHPDKVSTGGADSFFFSDRAAGIADGVGEWEWRFKLDPRKFAEQLMRGCLDSSQKPHHDPSQSIEDRAVSVLADGYEYASAFGSSTACVVVMDDLGEKVGIANLGDSGCLHYRKQFLTSAMSMTCVMKTRDQQHAFNMPYQLSRLPKPEHYDDLAQDPIYSELVTTLRSLSGRQLSKIDKPIDCDVHSSTVVEGDLIILATDGVLDNLWSYDILSIVGESAVISPFEARINLLESGPTDPEEIARALALAAYEKSVTESGYKSPFGVECRKRTGAVHLGGKMDDISVVACWVTSRRETCDQLVCRDWWRTRGGRVRKTSIDEARKMSKYEQFMSNET
jgi:protein phosphatase PTC7